MWITAHIFVHDICYTIFMIKKKIIEKALKEKRDELIKALYDFQGYSFSDIAFMFKLAHTTVLRICNKK